MWNYSGPCKSSTHTKYVDSNLVRTTFRLFIYGTKVDDYSIILCYFGCKVTMGLGTCWWSAHHAPSLPTRGIPRLAGRTPAHTTSKGAGVAARKQTALRAPLRLIIPYFLTLLTFKNSSEIAGGQRRSLQPRGWGGGPLCCLRWRRADGVYYDRMRVIRPANPHGRKTSCARALSWVYVNCWLKVSKKT